MSAAILHATSDISLELVEQVAYQGRRLELSPELLASVDEARSAAIAALERGDAVYGVTTGTGYLAGVKLASRAGCDHQAGLLLGRAVGSAPYLSPEEVRALLVARLVNFTSGASGVSAALCVYVADRLNDGFTPAVPRRGSGTAGEIIALAHAFQTFMGVGSVLDGEGLTEAADALRARGVAPYRPGHKEGIAILAGAPASSAVAIGRLRAGWTAAGQLLVVATASAAALAGPQDAYHPAVADLAGDPLMADVSSRMRALLGPASEERRVTQAPISFRVIPQVHAHLERTLLRLEEDLRRALGAVTDSPAFVDGRFVSTGGFHEIGLAAAMDALAVALCHAAELSVQRLHRLLDSRFTGLSDQLTPTPGPSCGLVVVHKRALGVLNELRRLAAPVSIGIADTSLGQEDAMTFGFEGAERLRRAEELMREITACELLAARQALWLRPASVGPQLADLLALVQDAVPPVEEDRPYGRDIDALVALLARGALRGPTAHASKASGRSPAEAPAVARRSSTGPTRREAAAGK